MSQATPISAYEPFSFEATMRTGSSVSHTVYFRGDGPAIILIQELPGIGQETLRLADKFVDAGFSLYLPHLFGPVGKTSMGGNLLRVMCMRREFSLFATNRSSPIVDWLRALCQHVRQERNLPGVGVIGMCLTGNFAISLMGDDSVLASVASQPAMPLHKQAALRSTTTASEFG
jgi:dienelactone hydrolase